MIGPAEQEARAALCDAARQLAATGLNRGTAGNLSMRLGEGLLVTPTGVPVPDLTPAAMVSMAMDGAWTGAWAPTSEWRIHRDILASRADVAAVVHAHPPFCTALACLHREIPPFHYMVAVAGGDSIRCAGYATFGTQELSDLALAALQDRRACLLANHGMLAVGRGLRAALKLAVEVEELAEQYWRALQIGPPVLLDPAEMARVRARFAGYGQPGRAPMPNSEQG